jgi:protein-tyrosine phosphatase
LTTVPELRPRRVPLEGARNFRDLGGYRTPSGDTAWGCIYRSDALNKLTTADVEMLLELGIRTVVDLRHENELKRAPNVFATHATVSYHHNPVTVIDPTGGSTAERLRTMDFRAHNIEMIRDSAPTFAYLFHLFGDAANYPLVFHCAGGRDRTGVAAALALTAAGVARDQIVTDYILSNDYLVDLMAAMSDTFRAQNVDPEPVLANLELRESYLAGMLDLIDAELGGIQGYLQSIGVSDQELHVFREVFLTQ